MESLSPANPKSRNSASALGVGDEIPRLLAEAELFPATSLTTMRALTVSGVFRVVTHLQEIILKVTPGFLFSNPPDLQTNKDPQFVSRLDWTSP